MVPKELSDPESVLSRTEHAGQEALIPRTRWEKVNVLGRKKGVPCAAEGSSGLPVGGFLGRALEGAPPAGVSVLDPRCSQLLSWG